MSVEFKDKIVVVTGGSRGIGAEIVKAFASNGAIVHFTYQSNHDAARLVEESFPNQVKGHQVDGCHQEQVENFLKTVGKMHKKIDVLVNNAGLVIRSLLANLTLEDWDRSIQTNLRAPFLYCTKALRYLMKSDAPAIVNISSVTADRVSHGLGIYCASKAGLESISKVLALEYASYKIRVNTIAPGLIETDMSVMTPDEVKEKILKKTPLGRMGKTEEVTNAVLFLASQKASYITGSQVYVTGGRHLE